MPLPTPPEPIFDSTFITALGTISQWSWVSAGINDPNGVALGQLQNASGTVAAVGPGASGSGGAVSWYSSTITGSGWQGLYMTQADASKVLASGAYISGNKLVSGGTIYLGKQYAYSAGLVVFHLVTG